MKYASILLLFVCLAFASFSQTNRTQARIQCEHGNFAIQAGFYDDALKIFNDCIIKYDSIPDALFGAARAEYYLGNYKKAAVLLSAVINTKDAEYKSRPEYQDAFRFSALVEDCEKSPFEMVYVIGGVFTVGCKEGIDVDCEDEEKPAHKAETGDFFIGKYEVTQSQWTQIMGTNPSGFTGCNDCPVENVSWDDIQIFINKLNHLYPSMKFRLPNETEWEYAARGGNKSKGFKYCGSNNPDEVGWFNLNSENRTHPVGKKNPNELGLYDMGGNVWEWCSDWFFFYSGINTEVTRGTLAKSHRTDRGGCWQYTSKYIAPGTRGGLNPEEKSNDLGVRLARSVK